ncbi:MAG: flagellar hook-associated protein 3 [Lachnospiraceae bacterium]|nr:flagellar hook-associated protein 3 [Lachnospiraceae bacterium]
MRITNNMIMNNSSSNINGTKTLVNARNTQMTTQKKIDRPSEDPVIAVRSLRLQTSLSKVNQYYEKNIPDAESWMDVTETALLNIRDVMTDFRTLCVNASTGTLTQDDRNTITTQLEALQQAVFSEGNADYAGRTVFTGFRTDKNLTFTEAENSTKYTIEQRLSADNMVLTRYYNNEVTVPTNLTEVNDLMVEFNGATTGTKDPAQYTIQQSNFYRLRLGYDQIDGLVDADGNATKIKYTMNGTTTEITPTVYESEEAWAAAMTDAEGKKSVPADGIVVIKSTGDLIFGDTLQASLQSGHADITVNYTKTGFNEGDLRPEYYYDCQNITDPANVITYDKVTDNGDYLTYDINYTVAQNQTINVNMEACEVFDGSIQQDMIELREAVNNSIEAHDKVDKIKSMMAEETYSSDECQAKLTKWLDMAKKEMDYYDNNLSKMCSENLGRIDSYLADVSLAVTRLGCTMDQLELYEKRMNDQQQTVQSLQSTNDDLELSEIIIQYTASYNAYQASLTAAGKLSGQTLLNYI